jgi:hypothetical protein
MKDSGQESVVRGQLLGVREMAQDLDQEKKAV